MTWELIFQLAIIAFMALVFFIIAGAAIASIFNFNKRDKGKQREEQDGRKELG